MLTLLVDLEIIYGHKFIWVSNGHLSDGIVQAIYIRSNYPRGSGRSYSVMNLDSDAEYSFKDHFLIELGR